MMTTQEIFDKLTNTFSDAGLELKTIPVDSYILVKSSDLLRICEYLYSDPEMNFNSLVCLSGLDLADGVKKSGADGSVEFEGGNLASVYHLHSLDLGHKIILRVVVPKENPVIPSVEKIWRSADYQEREAYDILGIIYENHHDLIRILLPYDWEGYPLRKDYKVPEFYQGMRVPN